MSWRNHDKCVKPGPEYSGVINFNPRFKEILKPFLCSLGSYNHNFFFAFTQNRTCVSPKQRLVTYYKKVKRIVDIFNHGL